MTPTRREKIEGLLRDDPGDVFLRYSLALELESAGEFVAKISKRLQNLLPQLRKPHRRQLLHEQPLR